MKAVNVLAAMDADALAHDLFGPTVNALTVDARISGLPGAISSYSSKKSGIKTGSKSGVVFKTGGCASQFAPGDETLSTLIGKATTEAATLTVQFRPTIPRKTVRIKITMVSEEKPERLQQGFDDVFAASLDGKMIAFVRAADTKEPTDRQKADNPNALRSVSLSEPINLSNGQLHLLKIAIASVGDASGPSTAVVSFEGEPESELVSPLLAYDPPTTVDHPGEPDQPQFIKKSTIPPWQPVSAPPPPTEIFQHYPVAVPDRSSSLFTLLTGCICLTLFRYRTSPSAVSCD